LQSPTICIAIDTGVPLAAKSSPHTPPVQVTVWQSVVVPGQSAAVVQPLIPPPVPLAELELALLLAVVPPPVPVVVASPPLLLAVDVFGGGGALELVPSPPHDAAPTVVSANRTSKEVTVLRDVMGRTSCTAAESGVNVRDSHAR
jgi:hypothetical protein